MLAGLWQRVRQKLVVTWGGGGGGEANSPGTTTEFILYESYFSVAPTNDSAI